MTDDERIEGAARACYEAWAKRMDLIHPLGDLAEDARGRPYPRFRARRAWRDLTSSDQQLWHMVAMAAQAKLAGTQVPLQAQVTG